MTAGVRPLLCVAGLAAIAFLWAGCASGVPEGSIASGSMRVSRCLPAYGSFGSIQRPPGCWRPYRASSPFNRALPAHPKLASDSAAVVRRVLSFGAIQNLTTGQAGTSQDFGRPLYFSRPGDPVFTLACIHRNAGPCLGLQHIRIRVPDAARPAGGSDGHMTVIDQARKLEYDLWRVQSKPPGGGELRFSAGGVTSIDGDGRGSGAVAAGYGTAAGLVREEELASGQINHALFMFVHCDSGRAVYPAQRTGESCAQLGEPTADAPPEGARFQLAMSDVQIAQLSVPAWKKTILRAMARYGMVVGDTGGQWGIATESGLVYTSFGRPDQWVSFSQAVGAPYYAPDRDYVLNLADGVDWARYLRVVAPCVSAGNC